MWLRHLLNIYKQPVASTYRDCTESVINNQRKKKVQIIHSLAPALTLTITLILKATVNEVHVSGHPPVRNFNGRINWSLLVTLRHYWSRDLDSAPREAVLPVCVSSFLAFYCLISVCIALQQEELFCHGRYQNAHFLLLPSSSSMKRK